MIKMNNHQTRYPSRSTEQPVKNEQHVFEIGNRSFVQLSDITKTNKRIGIKVSNHLPMVLIAGPCQLESREHAFEMADAISSITKSLNIDLIFKTSFDKANRTSLSGKRGIGISASLQIFADIRDKFNCPVLTDIHEASQTSVLAEVVDVIQIPAFLCRQTDLLVAAAKTSAQTGVAINVKKGQFLAPWDMQNVVNKLEQSGASKILLTERGVSFGYNTLVNDMRSLPIMQQTGYPVVFPSNNREVWGSIAEESVSILSRYLMLRQQLGWQLCLLRHIKIQIKPLAMELVCCR